MNSRSGRLDRALIMGPIGILALLATVLLARGVFFDSWAQDIFIPLGGVVHLQHGHWPHRDFGTPVGSFYYFLNYLPTLIAPLSARTVIWSSLIVGFAAVGAVLASGRTRLPSWAAALLALYVGLIAISPRQIGEPLTFITNNASYNRWSWALLVLLAFLVGLPRRDEDARRASRDGIIAGLLLTMLLFLKVTYFVAGVGLIVVAAATVRRSPARFVAAAALIVTASVLLIQLTTGLVENYLADLRAAASVQPSMLRLKNAYTLSVAFAPGGLVVLLLALAAAPAEGGLWSRLSSMPMALATFGAGLFVAIQNHPELENPMLPIAALIAWFSSRPADARTTEQLGPQLPAHAASLTVIGLFLIPVAQDIGACLWAGVAPVARGPEVAWLRATPVSDLRLAVGEITGASDDSRTLRNDVELAAVLGDGVSLLDRHLGGRRDAAVLSLTWSNPWPVLMGLRPVRHELAWWDRARTFDEKVKPDPSFLRDVDYILVPVRSFNSATTATMQKAYAPALEREFLLVERTKHWTLLAKRNCAARSLC